MPSASRSTDPLTPALRPPASTFAEPVALPVTRPSRPTCNSPSAVPLSGPLAPSRLPCAVTPSRPIVRSALAGPPPTPRCSPSSSTLSDGPPRNKLPPRPPMLPKVPNVPSASKIPFTAPAPPLRSLAASPPPISPCAKVGVAPRPAIFAGSAAPRVCASSSCACPPKSCWTDDNEPSAELIDSDACCKPPCIPAKLASVTVLRIVVIAWFN